LTRYHQDTSSRLCFLLGAREAIQLMMSVKEAPSKLFFNLNYTAGSPEETRIKSRVLKSLQKQGYDITEENDFSKVYSLKIRDRKQEFEEANEDENSELLNKFVLDDVKSKSLPQVILRRQASIDASMGASIKSGDISVIPALTSGDDVLLMDKHYNIVAHGVANLSSEEIKRSPGRTAIRTIESRYDVPIFENDKIYTDGMISVSTLPRLLGVEVLDFDDSPANIMVISQDNGEIAAHLLQKSSEGSKIYLFIKNENHKTKLENTFSRLNIPLDKVEFISRQLDRYAKSRPRVKFTHVYLELPSTESGKRPNPYFDIEEKSIISNARTQFSSIRSIALIGQNNTQIAYVTHSIDPTENEEVIVQAFRQGTFIPGSINESLKNKYPHGINALPEIPTVTQAGTIDLEKLKHEMTYKVCWLGIDPREHDSDAGFVAKLQLNLK